MHVRSISGALRAVPAQMRRESIRRAARGMRRGRRAACRTRGASLSGGTSHLGRRRQRPRILFELPAALRVLPRNASIANGRSGADISMDRLAKIFLELQNKGALNVNLVTATHYAPQVVEALVRARERPVCSFPWSGIRRVMKLLRRSASRRPMSTCF